MSSHTVDEIKEVVESEKLLKPIVSSEEFPVCVHGTYRKNLDSILVSGLKSMTRLHVHFASGLPTDGQVISDGTSERINHDEEILNYWILGIKKRKQRKYLIICFCQLSVCIIYKPREDIYLSLMCFSY